MIRLLGASLVVCGFGAWGAIGAVRLSRRSRNLAVIARAFSALRAELCTRLTPLPELFDRMRTESEEPFRSFSRNLAASLPALGEHRFSELWLAALGETRTLGLQPDEYAVFADAGRSLGRYDVEEQREALLYAQERFREFAARAERVRERDARTRLAAGLAAGIAITIILF